MLGDKRKKAKEAYKAKHGYDPSTSQLDTFLTTFVATSSSYDSGSSYSSSCDTSSSSSYSDGGSSSSCDAGGGGF